MVGFWDYQRLHTLRAIGWDKIQSHQFPLVVCSLAKDCLAWNKVLALMSC